MKRLAVGYTARMARTHRRIQDGGHPSQGPVREMANPTPSPAIGEDFPDEPDEANDGRPQDQPDPDAFAAKLGLVPDSDDDRDGDGDTSESRVEAGAGDGALDRAARSARSVVGRMTGGLARGLDVAGSQLQRLARRLDRSTDD